MEATDMSNSDAPTFVNGIRYSEEEEPMAATYGLFSRVGNFDSPSFTTTEEGYERAEEDLLSQALDAGWLTVNDPDESETEGEWVADSVWVDGHGPVFDSGTDWIVLQRSATSPW